MFIKLEFRSLTKLNSAFGFVKNTDDGRVRIIAEGKEKKLALLRDWATSGSQNAKVEAVKHKYADPTGEFDNFTVKK